jgi:hypothetical protein
VLFGTPKDVHYFPNILKTEVDGSGTAILNYGDFKATLQFSKTQDSVQVSEIYDDSCNTLIFNNVADIEYIEHLSNSVKQPLPTVAVADNMLSHEIAAHYKILTNTGDDLTYSLEDLHKISTEVHKTIADLRRTTQLKYRDN